METKTSKRSSTISSHTCERIIRLEIEHNELDGEVYELKQKLHNREKTMNDLRDYIDRQEKEWQRSQR